MSDGIIRKTLSIETSKQMILAALAIHRFLLKTGQLPTNLSALVPHYLTAMPVDSMDGKFLQYRTEGDDAFLLYSVGRDGKDDGGDPTAPNKGASHDIWDGKDAVWPSAATEDEVADALDALAKEAPVRVK